MAIAWPDVERRREATGDDAARDIKRASAAAADVLSDVQAADRAAIQRVAAHLAELKRALTARLLGGQGLTSFKRASLTSLLDDVDRLVAETQRRLTAFAGDAIDVGAEQGGTYATAPIEGAGLTIQSRLPGLDDVLVDTTFRATASLLSPPMRQYADRVKLAVRRVVLAGETAFDEMRRLARDIDDHGDTAQFKAERIIRTEVGRVFNEATYQRAIVLAKEFPFLKKGWRASKDNRTRKGHLEAGAVYSRGDGLIPFNQPFRVRVYDERPGKAPKPLGIVTLRFPIDPEATPAGRLAAAATIMCRCNAFIDFDPADYRAFSRDRIASILTPAPATGNPERPRTGVTPGPPIDRVGDVPDIPMAPNVSPLKAKARGARKTTGLVGLARTLKARGYDIAITRPTAGDYTLRKAPGGRRLTATKGPIYVQAAGTPSKLLASGGQKRVTVDRSDRTGRGRRLSPRKIRKPKTGV